MLKGEPTIARPVIGQIVVTHSCDPRVPMKIKDTCITRTPFKPLRSPVKRRNTFFSRKA